jgi:hypothetical protein
MRGGVDRDEPVGFLGYLAGFLVAVLLWYLLPFAVLPPAILVVEVQFLWYYDRRRMASPLGLCASSYEIRRGKGTEARPPVITGCYI